MPTVLENLKVLRDQIAALPDAELDLGAVRSEISREHPCGTCGCIFGTAIMMPHFHAQGLKNNLSLGSLHGTFCDWDHFEKLEPLFGPDTDSLFAWYGASFSMEARRSSGLHVYYPECEDPEVLRDDVRLTHKEVALWRLDTRIKELEQP